MQPLEKADLPRVLTVLTVFIPSPALFHHLSATALRGTATPSGSVGGTAHTKIGRRRKSPGFIDWGDPRVLQRHKADKPPPGRGGGRYWLASRQEQENTHRGGVLGQSLGHSTEPLSSSISIVCSSKTGRSLQEGLVQGTQFSVAVKVAQEPFLAL